MKREERKEEEEHISRRNVVVEMFLKMEMVELSTSTLCLSKSDFPPLTVRHTY